MAGQVGEFWAICGCPGAGYAGVGYAGVGYAGVDALLFAEAAVCSCLASVWSWAVAEGADETAGEPASLPLEHPPNMDAPSDAAKKIANVLFFIVIPSN